MLANLFCKASSLARFIPTCSNSFSKSSKNKPEITAKAEEVYALLKKCYSCYYDESASVGRRYARADEMGVRYCITVDFDSLQDEAVTIRDRDTTQQERVKISRLNERLYELYLR